MRPVIGDLVRRSDLLGTHGRRFVMWHAARAQSQVGGENLELTTLAKHSAMHRREVEVLRQRVQELEKELRDAKAA